MILVIDDSPEDQFFHQRLIRKIDADVEIKEFTYAEEALEFVSIYRGVRISLILLDINLPRMNGFEFLRRFESIRDGLIGVPLIYVMSGSIDPNDALAARCMDQVEEYLAKPLRLETLREVLSKAADAHQMLSP